MKSTHTPSTKTTPTKRTTSRSAATLEHRNLSGLTNEASVYLASFKRYQFARLLRHAPLALPSELDTNSSMYHSPSSSGRRISLHNDATGKVKIILCVQQSDHRLDHGMTPDRAPGIQSSCLAVHANRRQVTLTDPTPGRRRGSSSISKIFTFDAVHPTACRTTDLCSLALSDAIRGVLRGQDGCILTIGHKRTGKTTSMLGSDQNPTELGIIPCAIAWLYSALNQQRDTIGTRFAIRVSAVELNGVEENFRDLLAGISSNDDSLSPSHGQSSLTDLTKTQTAMPVPEVSLQDSVAHKFRQFFSIQSEIRASSMERAACLLDIALRNRSSSTTEQSEGLSHMLFTLHVYQCRVENSDKGTNVYGGRTKLHLLDLGCGRYGQHLPDSQPKPSIHSRVPSSLDAQGLLSSTRARTKSLSISGMASVILALLTGQRHLPYRDSALAHLLKESLTGNQILPCILAHVDAGIQYYTETLQVMQLVSKIGRLRRRRIGSTNQSGSPCFRTNTPPAESSSSCGDSGISRWKRKIRAPRLGRSSYGHSTSSLSLDLDFSSSSEQSCDTVIYLGQERQSFRTNSAKPFRLHLAKLGPRGTADGSVDVESFSSGQLSDTELNSQRSSSHSHHKSSRSGDDETSAASRSVKRVMPRTNATAWPRISGFRKLNPPGDNLDETWIDGPVVMTDDLTDAGNHQRLPTLDVGQSRPITVSRSSTNPSISRSNTISSDTSDGSGLNVLWGWDDSKPAYSYMIPDTNNPVNQTYSNLGEEHEARRNIEPQENCPRTRYHTATEISSNGACNISSLHSATDNDHGRGNRALSDISEHTEETETNPEFSTIRSTSPADWLDQNMIKTLPHTLNSPLDYWNYSPDMFGMNMSKTNIPNRIGLSETKSPDIFKSYQSPTESIDQVTMTRSPCQPTANHVVSPVHPVRDPNTLGRCVDGESRAVDSKRTTNNPIVFEGCGEQTVGMDGFETVEIPSKFSELSVNSSNPTPLGRSATHKEPRKNEPTSADARESSRSAQSKPGLCSPNAAATQLRVAAWVNSLSNTSTPVLQQKPNGESPSQAQPVQNHKRYPAHGNLGNGSTAFGLDATSSPKANRHVSTNPQPPVACSPVPGDIPYTNGHMVGPETQSQQWFAWPEGHPHPRPYPQARTHSLRSALDSGYGTVRPFHAPVISASVSSSPRLPQPADRVGQNAPVQHRNPSLPTRHSTHFATSMTGSHHNDGLEITQAQNQANQAEELENCTNGKVRRFNVFRFFTLPIFRTLSIRKSNKSKKPGLDQPVPFGNSPLLIHSVPVRPIVELRGSRDPWTPIRLPPASFESHEIGPIGVSTPSRCLNQDRRHVVSPSQPRWDCAVKNQTIVGVPIHPSGHRSGTVELADQTCQSANIPPVYRTAHVEQDVRSTGMTPNTNASLTFFNYTSGLCASASRSGRRSITGGAASSGYESMRIGTSELSLSHPDSASECSGRVSQGFFTKDNSGQLRDRPADLIR